MLASLQTCHKLGGCRSFHKRSNVVNSPQLFRSTAPSTAPNASSSSSSGEGRSADDYRHPELEYVNYRREDFSLVYTYEARQQFLQEISKGEALVDLANAALLIASEDDALVSHSAVRFPVKSYLQRIERMANELQTARLPPVVERNGSPEEQLQVVVDYLFKEKGFAPPWFGRSNVPMSAIVQNPGVWEDPRLAYLSQALVGRKAIPAVLSILLADILRRLLLAGAIDFVCKIDATDFSQHPRAVIVPGLTRDVAVAADGGSCVNACSLETLVECLRYLKRAYWPYPWDSTKGGFRGAAVAFLDGQESAEGEAISRAAAHRLQRGIWTSPGGGDLRRALSAAEKLVILSDLTDTPGDERRDLAILYCHYGKLEAAYVELKAYMISKRAAAAKAGTMTFILSDKGLLPTSTSSTFISNSSSSRVDIETDVLVDRLLSVLARVPGNKESKLKPLTLERAMTDVPPTDVQLLPLTW